MLGSYLLPHILPYFFTLIGNWMNNVAKYQALILGLEMAMDVTSTSLQVFDDSKLLINQPFCHIII